MVEHSMVEQFMMLHSKMQQSTIYTKLLFNTIALKDTTNIDLRCFLHDSGDDRQLMQQLFTQLCCAQ
jgi:hypothetical protein